MLVIELHNNLVYLLAMCTSREKLLLQSNCWIHINIIIHIL